MNEYDHPWLRQVEVQIFPGKEWEGGGNLSKGIRIVGDGTPNGIRIAFSIHKHVVSTARPSTIHLYNLSEGLRKTLRVGQSQIAIRAGWLNTGLKDLCKGTLLAAVSQRSGSDIITSLSMLSGYGGLERSIVSKAWRTGTSLKNVIKFVASGLDGVTVDPLLIDVKDIDVSHRGVSFAGFASECLDSLARTYGFSWTINDGVFQALDDSRPFAGGVINLGPENGLYRAEPMLFTPFQMQPGVTITSILHPEIQPGRGVVLNSKLINKDLNRLHKVASLSHNGDTHTTQWQTNIEAFTVGAFSG